MNSEIKGPLELQREFDRWIQGFKFESYKPTEPYFRPGTELPIIKCNFIFRGSGMGDYVCYMPAMVWTAKNCPWLHGRIWVGEFFAEFARNIMATTGNKNWIVHGVKSMDQKFEFEEGSFTRGPGYRADGLKSYPLTNGTGGHLVALGFSHFVPIFPPPKDADLYPVIDFTGWQDRQDVIHNKYVVFTTGAVSQSRTVPGHYWNPIIEYVKSRGLTPVFLGARNIAELTVKFPDGCNYGEGIDLRDKTTMLEAAWVMKNAAAVVGLDNGLMHLAACTDANIVCAYNMVASYERLPHRSSGKWETVELSREELACTGCQSNMKNLLMHNFGRCLYGDLKCIDLLFANQAKKFTAALDKILS